MKAPTWVITLVTGAVLAFAVSGNPGFLDVHRAGVILMIAGVAGLWPNGGKAWLLVGRARLLQLLDQTPPTQGTRVPLDDLLRPPATTQGRSAQLPVMTPSPQQQADRQQRRRRARQCLGAVDRAPSARAGCRQPAGGDQ